MPSVRVNGVELAYSEAGEGFPLVWCHEFAGSMESWAAQVHYFSRHYRVITYNARGYPPSEVPEDPAAYSQDHAVEDLYGLLRALGIEQAYVGGLSMGGSTTLHFGIRHPEMARALIIAAAGSGSTNPERVQATSRALAGRLEARRLCRHARVQPRPQPRAAQAQGPQRLAGVRRPAGAALAEGLGADDARRPGRPAADLRLGAADAGAAGADR